MIALTTVNHSITLVLSNSISTDVICDWGDVNATAITFTPGSYENNYATASTNTIVAAPGSGVQRLVKNIIITNKGVSNQIVQLFKVDSGTPYAITEAITLSAGYNLRINQDAEITINLNSSGSGISIGTETPLMDGTASAGSNGDASDTGHIHPKDISRAYLHGFEPGNTSSVSYVPGTQIFTISGTYNIWNQGTEFVKASVTETVTITNTTGSYYIYYDNTGTLQFSTTVWNMQTQNPVSFVLLDTDINDSAAFDDRHQNLMDSATHSDLHKVIGAQCVSGFAVSSYSINPTNASNAGNQFAIASGTLNDEDFPTAIAALAAGGPYTVMYRSGASAYKWVKSLTLPFRVGATYPLANTLVGGSYQDTELTSGQYFCIYVFAVPGLDQTNWQFIVFPGQNVYSTLAAAQAETIGNLDLTGLPLLEFGSLYQFIFGTGNNAHYTGATGHCKIVQAANRIFSTRLQFGSTTSTVGMANPMSTLGDIIYGTTGGSPLALPGNASATQGLLTSTGSGSAANAPTWTLVSSVLGVGSAVAVVSPATTGLIRFTGMGAGTTRTKTVRDADDTILEVGGSYTPTGTWNFASATVSGLSVTGVKSTTTTGIVQFAGMGTGNTDVKTVRDASDTILELGGSYTPTGSWNFGSATITNLSLTGLKSPATTGIVQITGVTAGQTRIKTVNDTADTLLELAGSYTPTGTWNWGSATVSGLGGATFVKKTSDQSITSNTTLANDSQLVVTLSATTAYRMRIKLMWSSTNAAPNIKIALSYSGTTTEVYWTLFGVPMGSTTPQYAVCQAGNGSLMGSTAININNSGVGYADIDVEITTNAGGTFGVQWAQNTSSTFALVMARGSSIEYWTT